MGIELYHRKCKTRICLSNYFSRYIEDKLNSGFYYIIINEIIFIYG